MIKTALSASLIALTVLAPAASAAPEPKAKPEKEQKAPLLDDKSAKYCAELAAIKPDKKGHLKLTKEQLAFRSKFDCPVEEPKPEKGRHETKPEKPFDPSVIGSSKVRPS